MSSAAQVNQQTRAFGARKCARKRSFSMAILAATLAPVTDSGNSKIGRSTCQPGRLIARSTSRAVNADQRQA